MANRKREQVTVSFHYLTREKKSDNGERERVPFTQDEFDQLISQIESRPAVDLTKEEVKEKLRFRNEVPFIETDRVNLRTFFGIFQAAYWGHAYDNSDRGKIPADSISLRPFCFLLYLADSGRIYIASQYLGQFGGYTGLQNAVRSMLPDSKSIVPHSFRLESVNFKGMEAKEVQVSFSQKGETITSGNVFARSGVVVFKKANKNDEFEKDVSNSLFAVADKPKAEIRKAVAELLSKSQLMDVEDEQIMDCTVIAAVDGKRRTVHLLEGSNFASRFFMNVKVDEDGHPVKSLAKQEMLRILQEQIISRSEDV